MAMEDQQTFSQSESRETPKLTIDNRTYDLETAPDSVKILVDDMTRIAREVAELQFRLRQYQLSQQAYIMAIEKEFKDNNIDPISVTDSDRR